MAGLDVMIRQVREVDNMLDEGTVRWVARLEELEMSIGVAGL